MKRKRFKMLACLAVSVTVLAGCGSNTADNSPANANKTNTANKAAADGTKTNTNQPADAAGPSWKKDTSPFTFTQYFYGNWASNYLWKGQYAMKLATEKTGITIDRKLATGNDDDYLNTMIASGDLPDTIMLDWTNPAVTKLINNGMVYSMDELIEKYAPEFKGDA